MYTRFGPLKPVQYVAPALRPKTVTQAAAAAVKIQQIQTNIDANAIHIQTLHHGHQLAQLQQIERPNYATRGPQQQQQPKNIETEKTETVKVKRIERSSQFQMTLEIIQCASKTASQLAASFGPATPLRPGGAVVFVTHYWNSKIEQAANEIRLSCETNGLEFYVIMGPKVASVGYEIQDKVQRATSATSAAAAPDESVFRVLRPTSKDIIGLYNSGFVSMWASNHFIYMWFWVNHGQSFNYIWSIEYDVRWSGPLDTLWAFDPHCDFVYSDLSPMHSLGSNHYWSSSITKKWATGSMKPAKTACKQVFRCSAKFLAYLHTQFQNDLNAQDEIALSSHANQGQFSSASLVPLLSKSWTTSPTSAATIEKLWVSKVAAAAAAPAAPQKFELFHPVK